MPSASYDRYGLTGNPFRDLASESLEDVNLCHVDQEVDAVLRTILDEVVERENRALIAVTGDNGAGKTERLRLAESIARERKSFVVYYDVAAKTPWGVRGIANGFLASAKQYGLIRAFGGPSWIRPVTALSKIRDDRYDPMEAGREFGRALNESAPALLLLNDMHNMIESREVDAFSRVLLQITDVVKPGVLIMMGCYASYLAWLTVNHPALSSRINRTFPLVKMTDDEAALVLAKKMLTKRLVEGLDPTYPFDREAVSVMNQTAGGNPRRLLELADLSIEYGVTHRAYRVDAETVRMVVERRKVTEAAAPRPARPSPPGPPGPPSPATKPLAAPAPSKPA